MLSMEGFTSWMILKSFMFRFLNSTKCTYQYSPISTRYPYQCLWRLKCLGIFLKENALLYLKLKEEIQQDNVGTETWVARLRETLPKNGQLNSMNNILKTLPGDINKDNYKCQHKFF